MTIKEVAHHRWHHKGRLVSMKNNLLQLVETSQTLTDCERIQCCRMVKSFNRMIDRFSENTMEIILETKDNKKGGC